MRQGVYSAPKYLCNYPSQTAKKWPQDIECIIRSNNPAKGSLYLSNVQAAQSPATVKKLNVGAILSCAKGYIISHPKTLVPLYNFDISLHLDEAVQFIQKALQRTNIIVHCIAGVSRSVSMVIAYFMKCLNLTYNQAFSQVKSKRKIISPNDGFIKHLKQYEFKIKNSRSTVPVGMHRRQLPQEQAYTYDRTYTGQLYSPVKTHHYNKSSQLTRGVRNPESPYKQINQQRYLERQSTYSPNAKNYESIETYHRFSKSMAFLPDQYKQSPQKSGLYLTNISSQLSPRKSNAFTTQKPIRNQREQLYSAKKQRSGYFDSQSQQLNAKVQAIRQKYQQQRQQMKNTYASRNNSAEKQPPRNIYSDKNSAYLQKRYSAATTKKSHNYGKNNLKTFDNLYGGGIDLKTHSRLNNIDSVYIPRASTGYGLGYGSFGKRFY